MAAPTKPWESVPPCCRTPNVNNRMVPPEDVRTATVTAPQFQSTLGGAVVEQGTIGGAPPIPPRPMAGYSSFSSPYGAMSSPYGGYGGYGTGYGTGYGGGYGGFGGGYGGYGAAGGSFFGRPGALGPGPESWFIEAAEESSRSTFESIESFVRVFSSISQMMESTYMLVHSSFRAVVGVAEQMGRMRLHLAEVLSAISLARTLRWIVNFLRRWLGYPELGGADAAWGESAGSVLPSGGQPASAGPHPSRWPVLVYLLTVLGAPYFIYRLLRSSGGPQDNESWKSGAGEHFSAVCSYDFTAGGQGELSARAGQSLRLAPRRLQPRVRGWVLASDGTATGLLPAAYVKIRGMVPAGGAPGGPGVGVGSGAAAAPAAAAGSVAPQPAPAQTGAGTGGGASTAPAAAAGAQKKAGGCCGGKSAKPAAAAPVHAVAPATSAVAWCASQQSTVASAAAAQQPAGPITASVATQQPADPSTASGAAQQPAGPSTAAGAVQPPSVCHDTTSMLSRVPSNVTVVEVDPTSASASSPSSAAPAGSAVTAGK